MKLSTNGLRVTAALVCVTAVFATGCVAPTRTDTKLSQFFKTPSWKAPWSKDKSDKPTPYPSPSKIAVTWTPDVLVQTDKTPTRGFGGRLFFFDQESKAVPVEGTLTIHGFEPGPDGRPRRVQPFKFTPEQFTKHFSESDFGASYSIWIPWDAAGGEQKRVSLVATFQTTTGKFVQAAPTTVILPGKTKRPDPSMAATNLSPQYQQHLSAMNHHATRPSGLVTTTIRRSNAPNAERGKSKQSLSDRLDAIVANHRSALEASGETPFIDIPASTQSPQVMAASAEMPATTTTKRTMPRRIKMPAQQ